MKRSQADAAANLEHAQQGIQAKTIHRENWASSASRSHPEGSPTVSAHTARQLPPPSVPSHDPESAPVMPHQTPALGPALTLAPRNDALKLDGLTPDTWKIVLSHLNEYERLQAKLVSKHFKLGVESCLLDWLDPESAQGNETRQRIYDKTRTVIDAYSEARLRKQDVSNIMNEFACMVRDSASSIRCLDFDVWNGIEDAIVDALMANRNAIWQNVRFYFEKRADLAKFERLWKFLENTSRTVDFNVKDVAPNCDPAQILPRFRNLRTLELDGLTAVQLHRFQDVLAGNNNIQFLSIAVHDTAVDLFEYLKRGTHKLRRLEFSLRTTLVQAEWKIFWQALKHKSELKSLTLIHGDIQCGGLGLGRILQNANALEALELRNVKLGPYVRMGCKDWVERINLRTIIFDQCQLINEKFPKPRNGKAGRFNRKVDAHRYLLDIVARAPRLENLGLCLIGHALSNRALLMAFSRNRAARTVQLFLSFDSVEKESNIQILLQRLNLRRRQNAWAEIQIEHRTLARRIPIFYSLNMYRELRAFGTTNKTPQEWKDELSVPLTKVQAGFEKLNICIRQYYSATSSKAKALAVSQFQSLLLHFGSHQEVVALSVWGGFEQAARKALCKASEWQFGRIQLSADAQGAWIPDLEQDLIRAGGEQLRDLELSISEPGALADAMPTGQALRLTALIVRDANEETLEALRPLLGSENALSSLSIFGEAKPDAVLRCLENGSNGLRALHLNGTLENGEAMGKILHSKIYLTTLSLAEGVFNAQGMKLAAILDALPQIECLQLSAMVIEAGASEGCLAALRTSGLREIRIENCALRLAEAGDGNPLASYQELLDGLSQAPELRTLELVLETQDEEEISEARRRSTQALLMAIAGNPGARILRIDPNRTDKVWALEQVWQMNALRGNAGLPPISLQEEDSSL